MNLYGFARNNIFSLLDILGLIEYKFSIDVGNPALTVELKLKLDCSDTAPKLMPVTQFKEILQPIESNQKLDKSAIFSKQTQATYDGGYITIRSYDKPTLRIDEGIEAGTKRRTESYIDKPDVVDTRCQDPDNLHKFYYRWHVRLYGEIT